ncbi:MAG TPA: MotA/TolQ/ExbB proton channel family protein [Magnetospirillaceae bacterium]|jgi:biopolymer transport protein ExbB
MDDAWQAMADGLKAGGVFIYPLIVLALIAIAAAVDRLYVFTRLTRLPRSLRKFVASPAPDWNGLRQELRQVSAHNGFGQFFRAIADNREQPVWWIEARSADQAAQIERRLDQGLWILETIVTAAPLLGLLGTIAGMIGAFRLFGDSGAVDPGAVTGGVAEALISTAIGIVVALVALVAFNFFSHRRAATLDEMERLGTALIEHIRLERTQAS